MKFKGLSLIEIAMSLALISAMSLAYLNIASSEFKYLNLQKKINQDLSMAINEVDKEVNDLKLKLKAGQTITNPSTSFEIFSKSPEYKKKIKIYLIEKKIGTSSNVAVSANLGVGYTLGVIEKPGIYLTFPEFYQFKYPVESELTDFGPRDSDELLKVLFRLYDPNASISMNSDWQVDAEFDIDESEAVANIIQAHQIKIPGYTYTKSHYISNKEYNTHKFVRELKGSINQSGLYPVFPYDYTLHSSASGDDAPWLGIKLHPHDPYRARMLITNFSFEHDTSITRNRSFLSEEVYIPIIDFYWENHIELLPGIQPGNYVKIFNDKNYLDEAVSKLGRAGNKVFYGNKSSVDKNPELIFQNFGTRKYVDSSDKKEKIMDSHGAILRFQDGAFYNIELPNYISNNHRSSMIAVVKKNSNKESPIFARTAKDGSNKGKFIFTTEGIYTSDRNGVETQILFEEKMQVGKWYVLYANFKDGYIMMNNGKKITGSLNAIQDDYNSYESNFGKNALTGESADMDIAAFNFAASSSEDLKISKEFSRVFGIKDFPNERRDHPQWSAENYYKEGDRVSYNDAFYEAKFDIFPSNSVEDPSVDTSKWKRYTPISE